MTQVNWDFMKEQIAKGQYSICFAVTDTLFFYMERESYKNVPFSNLLCTTKDADYAIPLSPTPSPSFESLSNAAKAWRDEGKNLLGFEPDKPENMEHALQAHLEYKLESLWQLSEIITPEVMDKTLSHLCRSELPFLDLSEENSTSILKKPLQKIKNIKDTVYKNSKKDNNTGAGHYAAARVGLDLIMKTADSFFTGLEKDIRFLMQDGSANTLCNELCQILNFYDAMSDFSWTGVNNLDKLISNKGRDMSSLNSYSNLIMDELYIYAQSPNIPWQ